MQISPISCYSGKRKTPLVCSAEALHELTCAFVLRLPDSRRLGISATPAERRTVHCRVGRSVNSR
jgi:hypothetical protein